LRIRPGRGTALCQARTCTLSKPVSGPPPGGPHPLAQDFAAPERRAKATASQPRWNHWCRAGRFPTASCFSCLVSFLFLRKEIVAPPSFHAVSFRSSRQSGKLAGMEAISVSCSWDLAALDSDRFCFLAAPDSSGICCVETSGVAALRGMMLLSLARLRLPSE
jgi:hypothetical protein